MSTLIETLPRDKQQNLKFTQKGKGLPDFEDDDFYDDGDYESGDCYHCGGDGFIDGYEDDPLWFEPGEMERCASCNGSGRAKDMTIW